MHLKKFTAATLPEALRQVREAFGPDALVLSTRSVRGEGAWFGRFGRPAVEVTAAVERQPSAPRTARRSEPRVAPNESWRELRLSRALLDPVEAELRELRRAVERIEREPPRPLAEEIEAVKRLALELACGSAARAGSATGGDGGLLGVGLAPRHAEALASAATEATASPQAALRGALTRLLEPRLRLSREDEVRVELFVGPCGVGKTTSLAKLAGRSDAPPALISTDTHRYGGTAVLRRFAKDLNVPFGVAVSARELGTRLKRLRGRRVFVDTPGRSPANVEGFEGLRELRASLGSRVRVNLVLDATTKECDLRAQAERYRDLEPDALTVTKLDESEELSNLLNLLLDGSLPPLAWVAHGQRVPDDLRVADPGELAARLLRSRPEPEAFEQQLEESASGSGDELIEPVELIESIAALEPEVTR